MYRYQKGQVSLLEIIPPQVGAFCIGGIQERAGVKTDENGNKVFDARQILPICMAFDHRAVDFGEVAPFLVKCDEIFANPSVIREWV